MPIHRSTAVFFHSHFFVVLLYVGWLVSPASNAADRARDLGIPFVGVPGPQNAITDVTGIEVGHTTLIAGDGALERGVGPIRTGVTVVHPRGKDSTQGVFSGWFTLNASGEMTGTTWLTERGLIEGPIAITNTHSVGIVRDSLVAWMVDKGWTADWHAPVVAETYDGALNDINGQHVKSEHVRTALLGADGDRVLEGAVGGGTGMVCNGFKGGIGTASRVLDIEGQSFTVGVLVQCNYNWDGADLRLGSRQVADQLPVGEHCHVDTQLTRTLPWYPYCEANNVTLNDRTRDGSIIVVLATDAPLLPHQLTRLAKRPSLALGRLGAISTPGSGDIFVAFSTANPAAMDENVFSTATVFPNYALGEIFRAGIDATEEAIVNAMVAADTMIGIDGLRVKALPHEEVRALFAPRATGN
jgi:L-aminopeptidase/D-esterase-like protein